jgi:hypothetical protein
MKTAKICNSNWLIPFMCPECERGLLVNPKYGNVAGYNHYESHDTTKGYCKTCDKWFVIPNLSVLWKLSDLSNLKVIDTELFQEMLDCLIMAKKLMNANTLLDAGNPANIKIESIISSAEKA